MRIGVMLRHYDQHGGGVKVYTRSLLPWMLKAGGGHEYLFMYADPRFVGTYGAFPQVREIALTTPFKGLWDQWAVPRALRHEPVDLVFNPKYSIPLTGRCPSAWVSHGAYWYLMPEGAKWVDRLSHRFLIPRYAAKARAIIAVSETTRATLLRFLTVPEARIHVVYHGVDEQFRQRPSDEAIATVRRKYSLPDRFFLYSGAIYPPKNFGRLIQAFALVGPANSVPLVIAGGQNRYLSKAELELHSRLGLEDWVRWPGWIEREELPAFYAAATALVMPSLYEACPAPPLEAMGCECPVVTSDRYGTKEIAGGAALLVDPYSIESIAEGMRRILEDSALRAQLVALGRERVREFTWERCANQTLRVLESIGPGPRP